MAVRTGLFDGTAGIPPSGGSLLGVVNALLGVNDIQNGWSQLTLPGASIWQRLGGAGEIFANLAIDASMVDGEGEVVRAAEIGAKAAKEVEATVNVVDKGTGEAIEQKPLQMHHFATNKNSKFTPQLSAIAQKYGLDLNGSWNKELMPHLGRHPNAYHQYVLDAMTAIDKQARGSQQVFLDLYSQVKSDIISNPEMLNKSYWKGK